MGDWRTPGMTERNYGVPGALPEALRRFGEQIAPESMDHLWVFPPRVRGRTESGVLAAGCFIEGDRRLLVTMAYQAEETGKGIAFRSSFQEEGEAPESRLPQVIEGVVRRSADDGGAPRSIPLGGDPTLFQALVDELSMATVPLRFAGSTGGVASTGTATR